MEVQCIQVGDKRYEIVNIYVLDVEILLNLFILLELNSALAKKVTYDACYFEVEMKHQKTYLPSSLPIWGLWG